MAGTIEQDEATPSRSRSLSLEVGPLFAVLVAGLGFLRVATTNAIHVLFTDDAQMLAAVRWNGPWGAITYAHAGYLNLAPMTLAQALEWVPDSSVPIVYVGLWSTVVGLVGWFVADASRAFLESTVALMTIGAGVALVPIAAAESVGTIANIQWYLMVAAIFALACRVETPVAWAVVGLAALSAPAALALGPLLVWHRQRSMIAAWAGGVTIQTAVLAANWGDREAGGQWFEALDIVRTFVVASLNGTTDPMSASWDPGVLSLLGAGLIIAALVRHWRQAATVGVLASGALMQYWFTYGGAHPFPTVPRYVVGPAIIAIACVVWAAERFSQRALAAVVAVLAVCWLAAFPASAYRADTGVDWGYQVSIAECVDGAMTVQPAPTGGFGGSQPIELPC